VIFDMTAGILRHVLTGETHFSYISLTEMPIKAKSIVQIYQNII